MIDLRPYQIDCINSISEHMKENDRCLIEVPTGGGKTIIFSKFSKDFQKTFGRTLVLSHRDELVHQTIEKALLFHKNCGIIQGKTWDTEADFISASIETLIANPDRIGELFPIGLIVYDEAHHAPAQTYDKVLSKIIELNPTVKVIGATATPFRADDKYLAEYFNKIVYRIGIGELQDDGYLVPLKAKYKKIPKDDPERINKIVNLWKEKADKRKTILFGSTIKESIQISNTFNAEGIKAAYIDGSMSSKKRRTVMEAFRKNKIKLLTNVGILTEGYDDPEVECIIIDRKTDSIGLYIQIVGRGLRPSPLTGKKDCLVIDLADNPRMNDISGMENYFHSMKNQLSIVEVATQANRKNTIVSCGSGWFVLLRKQQTKGFSVLVVNDDKEVIEENNNLPYEIAATTLLDKWNRHRFYDMDTFERYISEEPTSKQSKLIDIYKNYFAREFIERKLSKLDAMNLLSYAFYRRHQYILLKKKGYI